MTDHTRLTIEQDRAALRLVVEHGYAYDDAQRMIESATAESIAAAEARLSEDGYRQWCHAHRWRAIWYALGGPICQR